MNDEINSPAHYMLFPGTEAIDVIKAALTPEEFRGYLKGNALKYRLRAGDKGPAEKCIAKANWYQARLRKAHEARSGGIGGGFKSGGYTGVGDFTAFGVVHGPVTILSTAFDEDRIDQIARSHGDGEHYGEVGQ